LGRSLSFRSSNRTTPTAVGAHARSMLTLILRVPAGSFTLGRYFRSIAIATVIWIAVAVVAVTVPPINQTAGKGIVVVFALGVI
jgi:hypothetical protein